MPPLHNSHKGTWSSRRMAGANRLVGVMIGPASLKNRNIVAHLLDEVVA